MGDTRKRDRRVIIEINLLIDPATFSRLQGLRLEVLIKLLRQREDAYQEMSNQKLDRLWNKKQQEKEKLFHKLRSKYVKGIYGIQIYHFKYLSSNKTAVENSKKCGEQACVEKYYP